MSGTNDLAEVKRRMDGALGALKHELGGLRTGRASAALLEPIHVEAYGDNMPLAQVATVSVPEARLAQRAGLGPWHGRRRREGDPRTPISGSTRRPRGR